MHHTRFGFVIVFVLAFVAGCGGVSEKATTTCGSGEVQKGDTCVAETSDGCKADVDCADIGTCLVEGMCHAGQCYYTDRCVGSGTTSSSSGGGACVPETNGDGSVEVVLTVELNDQQGTYVTVHDDWQGGWPATGYTSVGSFTVEGMINGLHKMNALLGDGAYLVEGEPTVRLTVAESSVTARFGGCPSVQVALLPEGADWMEGNTFGYAWVDGDKGPNVVACAGEQSCYAPHDGFGN